MINRWFVFKIHFCHYNLIWSSRRCSKLLEYYCANLLIVGNSLWHTSIRYRIWKYKFLSINLPGEFRKENCAILFYLSDNEVLLTMKMLHQLQLLHLEFLKVLWLDHFFSLFMSAIVLHISIRIITWLTCNRFFLNKIFSWSQKATDQSFTPKRTFN